jgi:hypothetical protein
MSGANIILLPVILVAITDSIQERRHVICTMSAPRSAFDVLMRREPKRKGSSGAEQPPAKRAASTGQDAASAAEREQPHEHQEQQQDPEQRQEGASGRAATEPQASAADDAQEQREARAAFLRALSGPARPAKQAYSHLLVIDLEVRSAPAAGRSWAGSLIPLSALPRLSHPPRPRATRRAP